VEICLPELWQLFLVECPDCPPTAPLSPRCPESRPSAPRKLEKQAEFDDFLLCLGGALQQRGPQEKLLLLFFFEFVVAELI
jgi:hypothetical protein